jgi:hypothetical protein
MVNENRPCHSNWQFSLPHVVAAKLVLQQITQF